MSKTIDNIKSGNYEVVDNQGVSVTRHFTQCLEKEFTDLEAKIAEKEKEIAYLTKQVKKFNNEAQKYFEDAYCNDFHNQDKISFAVEQLEQLRHDIWTNQQDDGYTDMQVDLYDLNDVIDVRIMQIKEGK